MSYNNIEILWRSPHNQPSPDQIEAGRRQFIARLRRRYLGFAAYFSFVLTLLSGITGWLVFRWMTRGAFDPAKELPALCLLALPWTAAIVFVRRHRLHRRRHPDYAKSIVESLQAALDENTTSIARAKGIILLQGISVPVLVLCIWQLHAAGMARPHEVRSMAVFFGGIILISAGWTAGGCLTKLRRERSRMEAVLSSYA